MSFGQVIIGPPGTRHPGAGCYTVGRFPGSRAQQKYLTVVHTLGLGAGKSTYCNGMQQFMTLIGREVAVINLDPANDALVYASQPPTKL